MIPQGSVEQHTGVKSIGNGNRKVKHKSKSVLLFKYL